MKVSMNEVSSLVTKRLLILSKATAPRSLHLLKQRTINEEIIKYISKSNLQHLYVYAWLHKNLRSMRKVACLALEFCSYKSSISNKIVIPKSIVRLYPDYSVQTSKSA